MTPVVKPLLACALAAALLGLEPAAALANRSGVSVDPEAFAADREVRPYDGLQQLLDVEAREAMSRGEFLRAWYLFWRLLQIDPDDVRALREIGRIACAAGALEYGERTLARVSRMEQGPDPEIHFLRGQALISLGRRAEGLRVLDRAEAELALAPDTRQHSLWRARIYALRGDLAKSEAIYQHLMSESTSPDDEKDVALLDIEAHIFATDWRGAEKRLDRFLDRWPEHRRARAMLAWVLENRGKVAEEIEVRSGLASEPSGEPAQAYVDLGRAHERAMELGQALDAYRKAQALGVESVDDDIGRLELQLSPEVAAGAVVRRDPTGDTNGLFAGAALPFGGRWRVAASARHESAGADPTMALSGEATAMTAASALGVHRLSWGDEIALGAMAWDSDAAGTQLGARGLYSSSQARSWHVEVTGTANAPWDESAATLREGGILDAVELQAYAVPLSRRLVFIGGGRFSRYGITGAAGGVEHAHQEFGAAGLDVVVHSSFGRLARAQVFNDQWTAPAQQAQSVILSYRHYEQKTDSPFGPRLLLVPRSRLDEISGRAQLVADHGGWLSVGAVGGVGYDSIRNLWQWRAGGQLLFSPLARARLSLSYQLTSETVTGFTGRRHEGKLSLHVDL